MIGKNSITFFFFFILFNGSISFAEMSAHKIIEKARENITSGTAIVEDYACSTRTAAFMKNELLDIYERYDVNKYAFTLVDDWAKGLVFYKQPDKFKYYVNHYYRSQTWGDSVFAPIEFMSSSIHGPFWFEKFKLISPLGDSCFAHYKYRLMSIVTLDDRKYYEIGIIPKTDDLNLVSGSIRIDSNKFAVVDMKISFRQKSKIRFLKEYQCELKYFEWLGQYHLCHEILISMYIKIPKMVQSNMVLKANFSDFVVNTGLPDTLFDDKEIDLRSAKGLLNTQQFSLAKIAQDIDERSVQQYKYSGRYISGTGMEHFIRVNRVEETYIGFGMKTEGEFSKYWRAAVHAGYGRGNKKFNYHFDFGHYNPASNGFSYGLSLFDKLSPVDLSVISPLWNSIEFILGGNDFHDYYCKTGGNIFLQCNVTTNVTSGLRISIEQHRIAETYKPGKYRHNPEIEPGRFVCFELFTNWENAAPHLPLSRWAITSQILSAVPQLNENDRGFFRTYVGVQRFQLLPFGCSLEADLNCGFGLGHLPLQYKFNSIHDRYRFSKDADYENWYGEGALSSGVSFFFGRSWIDKILIATRLRLLTLYKIQFMVFGDVIKFYDELPASMTYQNMFRFGWKTDHGFGLSLMDNLIQFEFSNRYIGLRIRPNFIQKNFLR